MKSLATETHDFRSKSYYDENEPDANNKNKYPEQPYQFKKKRIIPPPTQQHYDFPDEDVKDDFEEQENEEDVEEVKRQEVFSLREQQLK